MLSVEDNELLSRIGAGTPMGELMRRYWLPFVYSWELERDGRPLRVRLLGEDLIAFRDSAGTPAAVAEHCPHRGASLFFGRNEEEGLRCVYHGWKFAASGECTDMPNEPDESNFRTKVTAKAYHCAEQGGVVFVFMGPQQPKLPDLPVLEWMQLPEEQVQHEFKGVLTCNWMQALEGDIDSSHIGFLHSRLEPETDPARMLSRRDKAPRLEVLETEYGVVYAARRNADDRQIWWRVSQFLMPFYTMFPASADGMVPSHIWVPIDDSHTLIFGVKWHPKRAMPDRMPVRDNPAAGMGQMREAQKGRFFADWWPVATDENDFLIDRDEQRTRSFTGLPTVRIQDSAMTVSMGPIMNRSQEHLGTTDAMIIQTRLRLMRAARALQEHDIPPPGVDNPALYRVRSCSALLPEGVAWRAALDDWMAARTNDVLPAQVAAQRG